MSNIVKLLPNFISIFRIFCIPIFFFSTFNNYKFTSILVLLLAALSDFFDGYLARKLNSETRFGELLDPIADKLFSNSILWGICLFYRPTLPNYFLAVSLTLRDVILLFGGLFVVIKKIQVNIKPIYLSKICTAFIFTYIILSISFKNKIILLEYFGYSIVLLVVLTFYVYVKRFLKGIKFA